MTESDMTKAFDVKTVTAVRDRLVKSGLALLGEEDHDSCHIVLSQKGNALFEQLKQAFQDVPAGKSSEISDADIEQSGEFLAALDALLKSFDSPLHKDERIFLVALVRGFCSSTTDADGSSNFAYKWQEPDPVP